MARSFTKKQEDFCLVYLETGNASEAYRQVYSCSKMKPTTINRAAKQLLDNPKIKKRLAEIKKAAAENVQMTLEGHLEKLADLRDKAEKEGKFSSAITAEVNRGKVAGFYVEKQEITGANGSPLMPTMIKIVHE